MLDLDLLFQCFRAELEFKYRIVSTYDIKLIYGAYLKELTLDQFYDKYIYLPF